jgi:hypothetical protein
MLFRAQHRPRLVHPKGGPQAGARRRCSSAGRRGGRNIPRGSGWGRRGVRGRVRERYAFWDATTSEDGSALRAATRPTTHLPTSQAEERPHRKPKPGQRSGAVAKASDGRGAAPRTVEPLWFVRRVRRLPSGKANQRWSAHGCGTWGGAARTPRRPRRGLGRRSGADTAGKQRTRRSCGAICRVRMPPLHGRCCRHGSSLPYGSPHEGALQPALFTPRLVLDISREGSRAGRRAGATNFARAGAR